MKAPRRLKPTRAGWVFFGLILGVGFAALNTGNNLLYLVFSLMLAFLVLSGVLSESALRGIEVKRRLPRNLHAQADNTVRIEVRNNQRRVAAFAIVVEDRLKPAGDARSPHSTTVGRVFLLRIGAGETQRSRYLLRPERRGPLEFAAVNVSTRFPFGLFVKSRLLELGGNALVYPALHEDRPAAPASESGRAGETALHASGPGSTVSGVREFQTGDPLRRVHWKSSLRRNKLLVLQVENERDSEVEVELRTCSGRRAPESAAEGEDASFEWRVSRAATEVVFHLDAGLRVGLRTESERVPVAAGERQRARLLSFLARVEAAGQTA